MSGGILALYLCWHVSVHVLLLRNFSDLLYPLATSTVFAPYGHDRPDILHLT